MNDFHVKLPLIFPTAQEAQDFTDAKAAVKAVQALYAQATGFLQDNFNKVMSGSPVEGHYRAYYPKISIVTRSFAT